MYSDVEVAENVDEDFLSALALLHSSDVDSADKLRKMLDLSIEKKWEKTSARKLTMERKRNEFISYNYHATKATAIVGEFEDQLKLMEKSQREYRQDQVSSISTNIYNYPIVDRVSRSSISELCSTDIDDSLENEEIPRISIPDEPTGDGIVCKVCNGDKLGPLVLLECQECQDIYHPLCHQPPVVDIDVYDPRLVWRCQKCIDTSESETAGAAFVVTIVNDEIQSSEEGNRKIGSRSVVSESSTLARKKLREKEDVTKMCCFRRTRCRADNEENTPRKKSRSSQKNLSNPKASSHLRKRVGSKLSVSRASSAN